MRNKIINGIGIFFILLAIHFVGITFLRFVIGDAIPFFSSSVRSLWKDIFLFVIYGSIIFYNYRKHGTDIKSYFASKNHQNLSYLIMAFMAVAFLISLINRNSPKQVFLGVKYDFLILLPLIFFPMLKLTRAEFGKIFNYFLYSIKTSIVVSLFYAAVRYIKSSTLRHLGFSFSNTEFMPDSRPPAVYETADSFRVKRESGSFAGPNSLGFYVAFIWPIIAYYIKTFKPAFRILGIGTVIASIFLLFKTLSRTALLVVALETVALIYVLYVGNNKKNLRYVFYVILFTFALGFWGVTRSGGDIQLASIFIRADSNNGHVMNTMEGVNYFLKYPIGYGLGTAGPAAVQLDKGIIPENRWVQIFLETGLLGGCIYLAIFWFILKILLKNIDIKNITHTEQKEFSSELEFQKNLGVFFSIALAAMMAAGMLLHSFEDSMVNLTLFGLIGLYIGLKETGFEPGDISQVQKIENKSEYIKTSPETQEPKKTTNYISYSYHKPKRKKHTRRK